MTKFSHILVLFFFGCFVSFSQVQDSNRFKIKGSVKDKENYNPIQNVEVSTDSGAYTLTNFIGEYTLLVSVGDELIFRSPDFETVRYTIINDEDVDLLVEGYEGDAYSRTSKSVSRNKVSMHKVYLDSANLYKKKDIKKSIDFVTQSIEQLGKRANKKELASSLTTLGEVYQYHNQYDLAITSFKDAIEANKTTKTSLLLANVYILTKEFKIAEEVLTPLIKIKNIIPFQNVQLNESLGDVYTGLGDINKAVAFYENGLLIAKKNQITPKMTDLNSKIAEAYAKDNRTVEAEGFFGNSLKLAKKEAPQRAIQEKEKVADFYNRNNRYDEEIEVRKESLNELEGISEPVVENKSVLIEADTITSQRINYKIANAYISQDKYEQAIPYLQKKYSRSRFRR